MLCVYWWIYILCTGSISIKSITTLWWTVVGVNWLTFCQEWRNAEIFGPSILLLYTSCRMYFHYTYKTSIDIIFFIKVTVNYHVIDFYTKFYLIYKVMVFTFVQNFITCKITSYCFNSKVSPFLKFNISLVKQNIWVLCFIFWRFKFFFWNAQLPRSIIKFLALTAVQYLIHNTCSQRTEWQTAHPHMWSLYINCHRTTKVIND